MKVMKAISLWQPWASLMETGAKTIETRSWKTNYRGPLLICSAKGGITKKELESYLKQRVFQEGLSALYGERRTIGILNDWPCVEIEHLPFGKVLCVVDLVDCIPTDHFDLDLHYTGHNPDEFIFGDYSPGRFAWITKNLRPIEHIPITGQQGLFNVPEESKYCRR